MYVGYLSVWKGVVDLLKEPMVLASASPRRQELLAHYGIPFEVIPSAADEDATGSGAERVKELARRKCEDVASRYPDRLVLAADTLVCVDDEVLGKPVDEADALRMLKMLCGREHQVHTGVCLRCPDGRMMNQVATTQVSFLPVDEATLKRYIATGEPMDKAGAYAIQGRAGAFVKGIEGSPTNVIGLPLEMLTEWFGQLGIALF
ncbi:MAG: septum formation protein Maf [Clostridiales bacterium]|nr:septum formation protein Maf [Clostridiales bacterium]